MKINASRYKKRKTRNAVSELLKNYRQSGNPVPLLLKIIYSKEKL